MVEIATKNTKASEQKNEEKKQKLEKEAKDMDTEELFQRLRKLCSQAGAKKYSANRQPLADIGKALS